MSPLAQLRSVVCFGGGTGLGRLLSALSFLGSRLTGVVTTTDDGGSTGRLRTEVGCIAWGDLRNCLNQICTEPTLGRLLFGYRFTGAGALSGHNLGNLMLLALDQLTARPLDAVNLVRDFLDVTPQLLPMSEQPTALCAAGVGDETARGETAVAAMGVLPRRLWLEPEVPAPPEVLRAIASAELILLGPGSFVTSVLPSLLVPEIFDAVRVARCPRVLIANLTPEPGPVGSLDLREQLAWTEQVLGAALIDRVLWPASRPLSVPEPAVLLADVTGRDGRHDRPRLAAALEQLLAPKATERKNDASPS